MMFVSVDNAIPASVLEQVAAVPGMLETRVVALPPAG